MLRRPGGDPLLVSVRSGAKFSMPGMMETVLNIGLNDASVRGLARVAGDERFARDSYRRLIAMFGKTVLDIDGELFADAMDELKRDRGVTDDVDLTAEDLGELVETYKKIVQGHTGRPFPQHPREQLETPGAGRRVRLLEHRAGPALRRRRERIPHDLGTAVNVSTMVYGNLGARPRAPAACFTRATRPPASRATTATTCPTPQGRRGRRHPQHPHPGRPRRAGPGSTRSCRTVMRRWRSTTATCATSSRPSSAASLWMLQTRVGKRTAAAAVPDRRPS